MRYEKDLLANSLSGKNKIRYYQAIVSLIHVDIVPETDKIEMTY